jgi:hypothetical protein
MEKFILLTVLAIGAAACSKPATRECVAPPLAALEVERIGKAYLDDQGISASFRQDAETRVNELGCDYEYTEAEKLDSFGIAYVVKISRRGEVIDFYGEY